MNKKIIGICGLAGAGKDTVGDILVNNLPNWEKMSFASHLKDVASLLFGFDRKMLAGEIPEDRAIREQPDKFWSEKMGKDFTPRYALQFLGTNLLRNQLHQNIWVDCLERKILESDKNIVITDVRFPNEIEMIKRIGGEIWRVERGKLPKWFRKVEEHRKIWNNFPENANFIGTYKNFKEIPSSIKLKKYNTCSIISTKSDYMYNGEHWLCSFDGNTNTAHWIIEDEISEIKNIHESEWRWVGIDNPTHIFENNGTIEDLKAKVLEIHFDEYFNIK